ncbi:hypothetical protein [Saccharibacillus alkalitolerans]|uniref:Gram-positive cocci surface proteins LPxTG domain-containing protein n=1 Tax=Saccharibacillus alkalitolerans TaxID=2705290 RepID=A0ABX0FA73_9BACL|nr:hypothetical protein [Saccharibacillus alkalitolerans]NGZ77203.1 hypothetical protein [Saccharibacillus alkalitolerans]
MFNSCGIRPNQDVIQMKTGKRLRIGLAIFAFSCMLHNPANAGPVVDYVSPVMTEEIQALFDEHFAEYLNSMKKRYDTDGDFRQARLGNGIMVQQISLEGHDFFGMGYEFPLRLAGKTVGTVEVEQGMNEWEIVDVTPIADLDRELNDITKHIPSAQRATYIHDPNFRIRGFYVETDEAPQFFDILTHTAHPIRELYERIDARRLEPGFSPSEKARIPLIQAGFDAEADPSPARSTLPIVPIIAAIGFVTVGGALLLKMKKSRRTRRR